MVKYIDKKYPSNKKADQNIILDRPLSELFVQNEGHQLDLQYQDSLLHSYTLFGFRLNILIF